MQNVETPAPTRDPFVDYKPLFLFFIKNLNIKDSDSVVDELSDEDYILKIVKPLTKELSKYSRDILFRDERLFVEDKLSFVIFEESQIDICKFYRELPEESKYGFWECIEQLYVLGNLIIHHSPEKKQKFLELVRNLKHSSQLNRKSVAANLDGASGGGATNGGSGGGGGGDALTNLNSMFGLVDGDPMMPIIGDIASQVETLFSQVDNPAAILTEVVSGDMTRFNGLMENVTRNLDQKIANGELDRNMLEEKIKNMADKMGGTNPLGMMQNLAAQQPGGMGEMGGMGGMGGMLNMLQQMMQGQQGQQGIQAPPTMAPAPSAHTQAPPTPSTRQAPQNRGKKSKKHKK